jgi:hypothetical protein
MSSKEFFFIANNYQISPYKNLLNRFFDLPYNNENELKKIIEEVKRYNLENDDVFLKDIYLICKALLSLDQTSDITLSQKIVEPVWERLSNHNCWYLNDIRLINVMLYLFRIDTAIEVTKNILRRLQKYNGFQDTYRLTITYSVNLSLLLIKNQKFKDALNLLDQLLQRSMKHMHYVTLAVCYSRKAICLFRLGDKIYEDFLKKSRKLSIIYEDESLIKLLDEEFYTYCTD